MHRPLSVASAPLYQAEFVALENTILRKNETIKKLEEKREFYAITAYHLSKETIEPADSPIKIEKVTKIQQTIHHLLEHFMFISDQLRKEELSRGKLIAHLNRLKSAQARRIHALLDLIPLTNLQTNPQY